MFSLANHACCTSLYSGALRSNRIKIVHYPLEIDEEIIFSLAIRNLKAIIDEMTLAWLYLSISLGIHGLVKDV